MLSSATRNSSFTPRDKAYYADSSTVNFVRPGLAIKIVSAQIAADGTLSVDYKLTDQDGNGLDRLGVTSPGAVSTSFLVAYIPKGQEQFTSYILAQRTAYRRRVTATQASRRFGRHIADGGDGEYIYTYASQGAGEATTRRPAIAWGFTDSRNLTVWDLGTNYALQPIRLGAGRRKAPPAPRDVMRTASCNKCHDQLAFHGGSRRGVELVHHVPPAADQSTPTPATPWT